MYACTQDRLPGRYLVLDLIFFGWGGGGGSGQREGCVCDLGEKHPEESVNSRLLLSQSS